MENICDEGLKEEINLTNIKKDSVSLKQELIKILSELGCFVDFIKEQVRPVNEDKCNDGRKNGETIIDEIDLVINTDCKQLVYNINKEIIELKKYLK
jgi:hypothetical protein